MSPISAKPSKLFSLEAADGTKSIFSGINQSGMNFPLFFFAFVIPGFMKAKPEGEKPIGKFRDRNLWVVIY